MNSHYFAHHHGKEVGSYLGEPIYETIEEEGANYHFDRIAISDDDGCPLDQLDIGELMVGPGLIYRHD